MEPSPKFASRVFCQVGQVPILSLLVILCVEDRICLYSSGFVLFRWHPVLFFSRSKIESVLALNQENGKMKQQGGSEPIYRLYTLLLGYSCWLSLFGNEREWASSQEMKMTLYVSGGGRRGRGERDHLLAHGQGQARCSV